MTLPSPNDISQCRTLLVQEDPDLASLVMTLFRKAGMACHHAADSSSGLQAFHQQKPHMVLLSLSLPHLGNVMLCPQIRAISPVPIIILSVRTRREDQFHVLNLGADDFIVMRPPDEQLMMARILTLLRRVYSYGKPYQNEQIDAQAIQAVQSQRPPGWASCEACGYMGPQRRFDRRDAKGNLSLTCPHCDQKDRVRFDLS